MVKYSRAPAEPTKSAAAKVKDLRAHFKNTYNVVTTVKSMRIKKAIKYLERVMEHKSIVGFTKFYAQRHAQCKDQGTNTGRWPEKSVKAIRELLLNLQANCETKGLDTDKCVISHAVCQRAQQGRRRTYRAHGRVTPPTSPPTAMLNSTLLRRITVSPRLRSPPSSSPRRWLPANASLSVPSDHDRPGVRILAEMIEI